MPPAATAALTANGDGGAPGQQSYERGLDSGLAKAAPSAQGLSQKTYRSFRRRLDLFSRQCRRRGISVAVEGAFLVLSQLQDVAWDASESIDYDDIELSDDPFKPIVKVLDTLFQHEEEVELPERCQEFFEQFQRERQEELQAYLVRHATMLKKLKDLQVDVPPLLAGWHLLTRSGVPRWTHPQVKAMCNGNLTVEGVARSLTRMFGGDSKPNAKDTTFRNDVHLVDNDMDDDEAYETYYYDDEEAYEIYYNHEEDDYMDDAYYQDTVADEEIPQDLDEATLVVEDAYINYLDSRRKMRELALSHGFYPVVAIDMNDNYGKGGGKSYGKGRNSGGGGKSKGSQKAKVVARARARAVARVLTNHFLEPDVLSLAGSHLPKVDPHQRHRQRHDQRRVGVPHSMVLDSSDIGCQHLASKKSQMRQTWSKSHMVLRQSQGNSTNMKRSTTSPKELVGQSWIAVRPALSVEKQPGRGSANTWPCVTLKLKLFEIQEISGSVMGSLCDLTTVPEHQFVLARHGEIWWFMCCPVTHLYFLHDLIWRLGTSW